MKKMIFALTLMCASVASAAPGFDLKMRVSLNNGRQVASPHVITKANELVTMSVGNPDGEMFIELIATEKGADQIFMSFTIGHLNADGTRQVISKPQITALENETASIQVGDDTGEVLSLTVLAKKIEI